ncbi:hypothetical protein GUJ93_ZPchr0004g39208 [Zizania palustris]|uniref:MBD domain-containing protein n=1 Tax=Zizania palustris TaxID=103762 RepID=A0A8J5S9Z3_ZIZPA|nr:hypothetical protein GUJ93_ZPchr0004g39208 [Zizania palustris]
MAKSPSAEILDEQEAKQLEEATDNNPHEDDEEVFERPGWLPDGWIMEVYHADDGTILQYYTSPVSGYTFMRESDVMQYLFAGIEERFLESEDCVADNNLSRTHQWLPKGWLIEIRAGGENMDKMYKVPSDFMSYNNNILRQRQWDGSRVPPLSPELLLPSLAPKLLGIRASLSWHLSFVGLTFSSSSSLPLSPS